MSDQQDAYNRSKAMMAGATHNETYNPNTMRDFHANGTLPGQGQAPAFPEGGSRHPAHSQTPRNPRGVKNGGQQQVTSAKASRHPSDPKSVWAWLGGIGAAVGVFYTDLPSSVDPDYAWLVPVVAGAAGAFLASKFHQLLSALTVLALIGGAIYLFTNGG